MIFDVSKLATFTSHRSCSLNQSLSLVSLAFVSREAPARGKIKAAFLKEDVSNNASLRGKIKVH